MNWIFLFNGAAAINDALMRATRDNSDKLISTDVAWIHEHPGDDGVDY